MFVKLFFGDCNLCVYNLSVYIPNEDFPASGRLFVDASADHYLTIEDAVTVAELLLEKLTL